jgi:hypothetical protein
MATANETVVRSVLTAEREEKIVGAYNQAWNDWWSNTDRTKLSRWPRTRANTLFEYLANRLIAAFANDPDSRFIFQRESFKLTIDNTLVIRFKKANSNGVGSNIETQAEINFGELQTDLPGMPGLQKVEIVYALNATETAIAEITVAARNGDKRLWGYNINGLGGATVVPFVQPPTPVSGVDQMVVPKKSTEEEKSEGGEE